ncbi:MAG TPA: L-glutamate gamma-semialdehyde dehydrogenase [Planctomycetota bacterium]
MIEPFRNEPLSDFSAHAGEQRAALDAFRTVEAPLVIGGRRVTTKDKIVSADPCAPARVVGRASKATPALARKAMAAAVAAFPAWSRVPAAERADVLFRAAAEIRRRRWEFNATLILEVGKTWVESDADTAEAIDFCEYYGREMLRLAEDQPVVPTSGERNRLRYVPLGVGIIVSPWNFPCAILCGMAAAAVVAGNTVVVKPASVAPAIGWKVFEAFEKAGLPPGVMNFLPGPGGEVGDLLVDHPQTRFVSFTGSKEVGIRIYERAAKVQPAQRWLKRAVIEMGGKDAIVVDEDADLEAAAKGIVASAFGFQGQKCSACSRAIVVGKAYDPVLRRVRELTEALRVSDAREPDTQMGAVVDERQMKKVLDYVRVGRREGRLVTGGKRLDREGWFVAPTVIADVKPSARIAREEIFGPVLAFLKAKDYDDAMRIANGTEYGLTGAYYGHARLERAKADFRVGNLYLNRKCTGALVGVHPFGGFDMSGTCSKAGGPDYLRLFMESQAISEKT